jgi:hypothetical protein
MFGIVRVMRLWTDAAHLRPRPGEGRKKALAVPCARTDRGKRVLLSVFDEPRVEAARPKRSNRVHCATAEQPMQRIYWTTSTLGRGHRPRRQKIDKDRDRRGLFRLPPEPFADAGRGVNHEVDHCRRRHEFS